MGSSELEYREMVEVLGCQPVGGIIEGWNLAAGEGGIVYSELKKMYDGIAD